MGAGLFGRGLVMPRSQMFGKVMFRGETSHLRRIALTFDDGPHPEVTPLILQSLSNHRATATFFVVGRHAARYPQLVERIHREGHIVANHSFQHAHLGTMRGTAYWRREIRGTDEVVHRIIGRWPALFRPPMGFKTHHVMRAAKQQGHTVVTWTRRAYDGIRANSHQIVERLNHVDSGDIVLLHDGAVAPFRVRIESTERALSTLLHRWRSQDVIVQPLDQLLGVSAYASDSQGTAATL